MYLCVARGNIISGSAHLNKIRPAVYFHVICGCSITGDLCPRRPMQAEFRGASPQLKLGHTSSGGIPLAKAPFIPSALPCFFGSPQKFDLLCPDRKLCKRNSAGLTLKPRVKGNPGIKQQLQLQWRKTLKMHN